MSDVERSLTSGCSGTLRDRNVSVADGYRFRISARYPMTALIGPALISSRTMGNLPAKLPQWWPSLVQRTFAKRGAIQLDGENDFVDAPQQVTSGRK